MSAAGTEVWLEPHVPVVNLEVGVERSRLWTGTVAGHGKGVKQLLQVLPASDTLEETHQNVLLLKDDT